MRDAARVLDGKARLLGPIGAETAYRKAYTGDFQGVVAMYHDQATIPTKLIAFGEAVNVTMGLSVIRTSVDHGTGYDIAWQGKADPRGMVSALRLGARLVKRSA
jgi:4-hydroxythreonine-4-phosphate dehydrogenase